MLGVCENAPVQNISAATKKINLFITIDFVIYNFIQKYMKMLDRNSRLAVPKG
jgi:hypothetical protein